MSYETDLVVSVAEAQSNVEVDCPGCSAKNTVAANEYVPNKNGVFWNNFNYVLHCIDCGKRIIIQTKIAA